VRWTEVSRTPLSVGSNPPDEDFDEEGDECDLADIERQKRIDREDTQAEALRQKQEDAE